MLPKPIAHVLRTAPAAFGHLVSQREGVGWLKEALARSASGAGAAAGSGAGSGAGPGAGAAGSSEGVAARRAAALYERLLGASQIDSRLTCLSDYTHRRFDEMTLFRPRRLPAGAQAIDLPALSPPLEDRMALFSAQAAAIAEQLYPQEEAPPAVLLQVSCTGYDSPSAAQRLAARRGWGGRTRILQIGHMGCYAALPALSLAADLCAARPGAASLLLVELCTLHLRPFATEPDQVVMNSLFADGAIRIDVGLAPARGGLAILATAETLVPGSLEAMTWRPGAAAFHMTLSRDVPRLVGAPLRAAVDGFLDRAGLRLQDVQRFAIHPGGPRIIDAVSETLGVLGDPDATRHSRAVLRARGNMSSCTLPHVWHALREDRTVADGELILSLAFGPGLTIALTLLRKGP